MSEPTDVLTEEEKEECRKRARSKAIIVTRWLCAIVILAVLSLSWYGAEMLLYNYCQPSIVKAFVAVCIALAISGRIQKELIANDRKREFLKGFAESIQNIQNKKAKD